MGHGHGHGHGHGQGGGALTTGAAHRRRLAIALGLTASYAVVQVIAGFVTGSLALLSDAAHMGTDVLGLGLSLAAVVLANRPAAGQRTYGTYRLEVLAAVINGLLLFGAAAYILIEAAARIADPPDVSGVPVVIVAAVGLVVNVISFRLLASGSRDSINVRGAYLEVLSDMVGSVGVIVAGAVIWSTGWPYADAIVAAGIGLFILPRTYQLMRQAVRILMEVSPPHIDVDVVDRQMRAIPGVTDVHDLHIWTITSGIEAASVHVMVTSDADIHPVLDQARVVLAGWGVNRPTVQVEPESHDDDRNAPHPEEQSHR